MKRTSSIPTPAALPDTSHLAVFDDHRTLLFSIAYRMLGSVADVEDQLQETFIRWQQPVLSEIE